MQVPDEMLIKLRKQLLSRWPDFPANRRHIATHLQAYARDSFATITTFRPAFRTFPSTQPMLLTEARNHSKIARRLSIRIVRQRWKLSGGVKHSQNLAPEFRSELQTIGCSR